MDHTGEILKQWKKLQDETAEDRTNLKDTIITFLTTGELPETAVDHWTNANEINTDEIKLLGRQMANAVRHLVAQGITVDEAITAMFSAGFQLGFNVANARIGAEI